jgi:hypothetical protein
MRYSLGLRGRALSCISGAGDLVAQLGLGVLALIQGLDWWALIVFCQIMVDAVCTNY